MVNNEPSANISFQKESQEDERYLQHNADQLS